MVYSLQVFVRASLWVNNPELASGLFDAILNAFYFKPNYNFTTLNSVLRFNFLPASVLLSATGCVSPYPL